MTMDASPGKVLVCVRPTDKSVVDSLLSHRFNYTFCFDLRSAIAALAQQPDIVFCGVHFDEGALFALLHEVRANPGVASVSFVPVMGESRTSLTATRDVIKDACLEKGADTFVDLVEMRQQLTWPEISSVLIAMIETAIGFRRPDNSGK